MIEFSDLRHLFYGKDIEKIMAVIDVDPALISHEFESYRSRVNLLQMAIAHRFPELVSPLLKRGAKPLEEEKDEDNLINVLLRSGGDNKLPSVEVLDQLLDIGVEFPVKDEKDCQSFIRNSLSPMFEYDHVDILQAMIDRGLDPVEIERKARISMIGRALTGHYVRAERVIDLLYEAGCSVAALEDTDGFPLTKALGSQQYALAMKLIEGGADPATTPGVLEELVQCWEVPTELLDRLTESHDLNRSGDDGMTMLHMAVRYENTALIAFLVERGADIDAISDVGTPLMYAIKSKYKDTVKQLIELGADLNVLHEKLGTALDLAQSTPGFKQISSAMVKADAQSAFDLLDGDDQQASAINGIKTAIGPGEAWADCARETLVNGDADQPMQWASLLRHCLDNNSAKPSKKWITDANALVDSIGEQIVQSNFLTWLPLVKEKRTQEREYDEDDYEYYGDSSHHISENNTRLLKGLIWIASRFADDDMSRVLRELATHMYRKVYGVGMRNAKLGNAALYSLSIMPGTVGLKEIIVLRAATKYNPALVNINRVFDKLAEASGQTPDELAEMSTPDYGLTGMSELRQQVGEFEAVARLVSVGKCELSWDKGDKTQKSVPAAIKAEHTDAIKSIKAVVKDVQTGSSAHSLRLEQMYLRGKTLDYDTWIDQYVDHRLIGFLARRLIWRASSGKSRVNVMHCDGVYIDHSGVTTEVPADAAIDLWHPSMSEPAETLAWRNLLIDREITQPFKQAHREIYLLTDAERATQDHSMRFANHILKQAQFHALTMQRGWKQQRGGHWDGGDDNSAYRYLPAFELNVEFETQGSYDYGIGNGGTYECVATGEVSFSKKKRVDLESVDALLFSEVMRDIDLFVSVTSIGNDPDWRERDNAYWRQSSFGELAVTAKTRKEVLTALIPKLKFADQLSIDGRFLMIKGHYTTYKIHLGSSNILMAPNDRYLCIVGARSKLGVMLPFEGDHTLSLILSKASMLANDKRIKDESILSQIRTVMDRAG